MVVYKHEHTHLTSPDPEKVVEFYTRVLGAKRIKEREISGRKLIDMNLGGILIRVSSGTAADDNWKGLRFGLHHLGLVVDNIDQATEEMKSRGVEFVIKPTQLQPDLKLAFIKTPDNVLIEIIEEKSLTSK